MNNMFKFSKISITIVILLVLVAIFFLLKAGKFFTIIPTGYVGVKSKFGKYNFQELDPGINFKIPFIEDITLFNIRVRSITYKETTNQFTSSKYIKPVITVLDQRGLPIKVELTIQYQPIKEMCAEILANWNKDWEDTILSPAIRMVVRDIIGQYPAELIPQSRTKINAKITIAIQDLVKSKLTIQINNTQKQAIKIVAIMLRNITLPKEILAKIKEVQEAKLEAEKTYYLVEKAKKEREAKTIQAETLKIQQILKAQAEAQTITLKAQAQSKANKMISESITDKLIKWKSIDIKKDLFKALENTKSNVTFFIDLPKTSNLHMWLKKLDNK